jgi:hypothetical protein
MTQDTTDTTDDGPEGQGDPFAGMEAQATALEGAGQAQASAQAQAAAADTIKATADELADALKIVRSMGAPMMAWWPQFDTVWSDAALDGIATAGAAVMHKHGWTMSEAWSKLGPYIALVAATVPPSLVTWQAVKQRQAQLAYEQRRQHVGAVMPASQAQAPQSGNAS